MHTYDKLYYHRNRDKFKKYRIEHKLEYHLWYEKNKEKLKEKQKIYMNSPNVRKHYKILYREHYQKNKKKLCAKVREWVNNNKEKSREIKRTWVKNNPIKVKRSRDKTSKKRTLNPNYRINNNISIAIRRSLHSNKNGCHWECVLGYTFDDLKQRLESLFTSEMGWDNYGKRGWEIDHIKPISSFVFKNYNDPEFKECWALDNLQPLWQHNRIINGKVYIGNTNKHNKILEVK